MTKGGGGGLGVRGKKRGGGGKGLGGVVRGGVGGRGGLKEQAEGGVWEEEE